MLLFRNTLRLRFQFRKKVKNPKCHDDYLVGMHLTICIWTLEMLVCSHRNIHILTLKMFLFGNAFRLTLHFRKTKKKPKFHYDYLVGMHLTICIWTLERSVCSRRNIRILTFKTFVYDNALRLTFQFRRTEKNTKFHYDYLVGMHLTICIWALVPSHHHYHHHHIIIISLQSSKYTNPNIKNVSFR